MNFDSHPNLLCRNLKKWKFFFYIVFFYFGVRDADLVTMIVSSFAKARHLHLWTILYLFIRAYELIITRLAFGLIWSKLAINICWIVSALWGTDEKSQDIDDVCWPSITATFKSDMKSVFCSQSGEPIILKGFVCKIHYQ